MREIVRKALSPLSRSLLEGEGEKGPEWTVKTALRPEGEGEPAES